MYIRTLKKKVSVYWKSYKKLWIKYKIAKGRNDTKSMRKIEKDLIDVAQKLEITPPVFLVLEAKKHGKSK